MKNKNNFRFYVPLDVIEKGQKVGTDGKSVEVMKVRGVASTVDEDTDGDILIPDGFNLDYFLKAGFINYNHNHSPEGYIGEPVKAYIENNQLIIEGELYPWSPLAKSVYDMADNLKKSKSTRRMAWSIEGKAIERDLINNKIVKKANITGVAITLTPKNGATFLDIIKGIENDFSEGIAPSYDIESTEEIPNVGITEYILDINTSEGRLCVDKNMNVKIIKFTNIDKALTTTSGAPLMRESVEGAPKILTKAEKDSLQILHKAIELDLIPKENVNIIKEKIKEKFK